MLCHPVNGYEIFLKQNIATTVNYCAPEHKVQSRVRPLAPRFDSDCRALRRYCRKLERRYRRTKSEHDRAAFFTALHNKHAEFAVKKNRYWSERISADKGCPAKLWRSLARILRRDDDSAGASVHDSDSFIEFFDNKVKGVRASTADAPPATSTRRASATFSDFLVCSEDDTLSYHHLRSHARSIPSRQIF